MNSPEPEKIETEEPLANSLDKPRVSFIGVLLVGLTVDLGFAIMYISTIPETHHPILDKTIQIHNQKP